LNSCRLDLPEIVYGEGLLHRWDGDAEGAVQALEQRLALAQQRQDRWIEYRCIVFLMMSEYERGNAERVVEHASTLTAIGIEMGETDVPFARVLRVLATMRDVSDKSLLAYAMNQAAMRLLELGERATARQISCEALAAARDSSRREFYCPHPNPPPLRKGGGRGR